MRIKLLLLGQRFLRFGMVGLSGMIINLVVLYFGQEILYNNIYDSKTRLTFSLVTAISIATLSNYFWNRLWTWADRKKLISRSFFVQLSQYYAACWLAIALQFIFTIIFANYAHYLIANIMSIILTAVINFIINDSWTFALRKRILTDRQPAA